MPITNYANWLYSLKNSATWPAPPNTSAGISNNFTWRFNNQYGNMIPSLTTPSTPVSCNSSTSGSVGQNNTNSGDNYLIGVESKFNRGAVFLIYDRLCHQAGLAGNVTGAQTTNLPTAALTRYASGEGVMMAVETYGSMGGTPSTLSVSYTNSSGVSGRTSPPIVMSPSAPNLLAQAGSFCLIPLQSGDTGVRSVESVTLSVSTGVASGNFGITLLKPLAMTKTDGSDNSRGNFVDGNLLGGIPAILNNACIWRALWFDSISTGAGGTLGCSAFSVTLTES